MKVRMLINISGLRNGKHYPPIGGVMELQPGDSGDDLLRNHYAEKVGPVAAVARAVESVVAAPPENMAQRTTRPAPRKGAR
jgi:hypothetical protein